MADNTRLVIDENGMLTLVWGRRQYCHLAKKSKYKHCDRVAVIKEDDSSVTVGERHGHTERWDADMGRELELRDKFGKAFRVGFTRLVRDAVEGAWRCDLVPIDKLVTQWPELRELYDELERRYRQSR